MAAGQGSAVCRASGSGKVWAGADGGITCEVDRDFLEHVRREACQQPELPWDDWISRRIVESRPCPRRDRVSYCLQSARGWSPGLNEPVKRAERMRQVVNRADAECQGIAERSGSRQFPNPRIVLSTVEGATNARSGGINSPISDG